MTSTILNTSTQKIEQLARQWLAWDRRSDTRNEIQRLLDEQDYDALQPLLAERLAFGTAGLRGLMGAGFSRMNDLVVRQTTQGFVKYLLAEKSVDKHDAKAGIVIGYDNRHNSRRFAEIAASVFVQADIPVFLYSQICPTPYVPFAVTLLGAMGGIMITASHNPKGDNGYKVYWSNGAQIMSPRDKHIQSAILANLEPWATTTSDDIDTITQSKLVSDPLAQVQTAFMEAIASSWLLPEKLLVDSPVKIVYTPLHGVGQWYITKVFEAFKITPLIAVAEQCKPDAEFPTVKFPNPEEGKDCLTLAIQTAEANGASLILANDPDADRFAMAERQPASMGDSGNWYVFTGNEIAALLGSWLWRMFRARRSTIAPGECYMLASTVSSKFLRSFCQQEQLNFVETLTGFKYMGNKSDQLIQQKKHVIFAFEEAIGYMCGTHVLDKDGITVCIVAQQMCAEIYRSSSTLKSTLDNLYLRYGQHIGYNSYYFCYEPKIIERIFERIRNWPPPVAAAKKPGENENIHPGDAVAPIKDRTYPRMLDNNSATVQHVRDLTSGFDSRMPGNVPDLPISRSSQMITLFFGNGVEMTLRTSGTEPKIKFYSELILLPGATASVLDDVEDKSDADKAGCGVITDRDLLRKKLVSFVTRINKELLEPGKNALTPAAGML